MEQARRMVQRRGGCTYALGCWRDLLNEKCVLGGGYVAAEAPWAAQRRRAASGYFGSPSGTRFRVDLSAALNKL